MLQHGKGKNRAKTGEEESKNRIRTSLVERTIVRRTPFFAIFLLILSFGLSLSLKPTQLGPTVFASPPNWIPRPHGHWIEFLVFVFCFRTLGSYFGLVCWVRTANSFFFKLCLLQQFLCLQNSGSSLFTGNQIKLKRWEIFGFKVAWINLNWFEVITFSFCNLIHTMPPTGGHQKMIYNHWNKDLFSVCPNILLEIHRGN